MVTPQSAVVKLSTGEEVINFCANNYLGLSHNKHLEDAAKKMIDTHGYGLSSVRFICGTQDIHKNLEKRLAHFHKKDDCILYSSCFDANGGIFEVLLKDEDSVISDALNHASIIDGVRLCKAKRLRYEHMNMKDLEAKLIEAVASPVKLIVTDGVFSMDGDVAPLVDICDLADKYNALVMIDECHATGFFGEHGRGTPEYWGVEDRIDIVNSTLGKALGGATGGYTCATQQVVDLLRQRARPYLFSNSVCPPVVGASLAALDLIEKSNELPMRVMSNTNLFRQKMAENGFKLRGSKDCPICPVMVGDARKAALMAEEMGKRGIYVVAFSYPVVPQGLARIRVQISAAHTEAQIEKTVAAFAEVAKVIGLEM
jgi:glycine C-acetyltransferase